jgi:hypothetical protein
MIVSKRSMNENVALVSFVAVVAVVAVVTFVFEKHDNQYKHAQNV